MKKLLFILALLFSSLAHAGVPNVFATMPSGNVSASTLDANFAYLNSSGSCIQTGTGSGAFGCLLIGGGLTYSGGTLATGGAGTFTTLTNSGGYTQSGTAANIFTGQTTFSGGITLTKLLFSNTAPVIASGFGTAPSITNSNGTASLAVNVGTGGTATSGVLTFPAATTNWNCAVVNPLSGVGTLTQQTAHTSTSVTLSNFTIATDVAVAWTASYVIELNCVAK